MAGQDATSRADVKQIDVEEIMALVRARAHGQAESSLATDLGTHRDRRERDSELYRSIHQASTLSGKLQVDYQLGWKTPVIGHAWLVVRRRIHQEIRIYIDALTRQQSAFNYSVARALARIAGRLEGDATREELAALRTEVEALRAEVRALRERLLAGEHGET